MIAFAKRPQLVNRYLPAIEKTAGKVVQKSYLIFIPNSTLSDYMIYLFQDRHSGMDCRNPGPMDGFEPTIHGTGYPLPGGYDDLCINLTK